MPYFQYQEIMNGLMICCLQKEWIRVPGLKAVFSMDIPLDSKRDIVSFFNRRSSFLIVLLPQVPLLIS
jgi:hypothetical protein